jgi:hypothetical protein
MEQNGNSDYKFPEMAGRVEHLQGLGNSAGIWRIRMSLGKHCSWLLGLLFSPLCSCVFKCTHVSIDVSISTV